MKILPLIVVALGGALSAQALTVPVETRPFPLDSGYLDNSGPEQTVFVGDVHVPEAAWLRIYFGHTNLPEGSRLRLTSLRDGAVQRLDARALRDYGFSSAYLNGERVTVELLAGAGTRGNRVQITRVELQRSDAVGPDTICGNTDDRALFSDARVGRAVSGGSACTWWLINEFTLVTAGHCADYPTSVPWIVGFNIPLSQSNGTMIHPPPDDQYPVDTSTLSFLNAGRGADWAVMASLRNSNHNQYAGQRQGDWFSIGAVPPQVSGVDIRITGNGRVTAPVPLSWSSVTKTHVGPRVSTSIADALRYQTDTSGGNSGSPIIHEQTGEAIGVHSHGGCTASGGGNYGTRVDRPDFAAAISQVLTSKVAGRFERFGTGCPGAAGVPQLGLTGVPDVGGGVTVELGNLPTSQFGLLLIGFSNSTWQGNRLPLDMGPHGLPGCALLTSPDLSQYLASGGGQVGFSFTVPTSPAVIATSTYFQYLVADPGVAAPVPAAMSNAGEVFVGG